MSETMWGYCLALWSLVFVISIDYAVPRRSPFDKPERTEPDWDLLVFTQQWPVTVCREWKDHNPDHKCSMPDQPDAWTIHGIWPTKLHTMGPSFCNRTWHFDQKLIQPIEKELNSSWKNIEIGTSTYSFWAHEWNKHGTCAAVLDSLNSELKYFSKGLDWFKTFNMKSVLEAHQVYPSDNQTYLIIDLHRMINIHFGITPMIECRKEHGKNWLSEIRFCFDKKLRLKDCDGVMNTRPRSMHLQNGFYMKVLTNCDFNAPVLYPKTVDAFPTEVNARSLYVPFYMLITWLQWFTL